MMRFVSLSLLLLVAAGCGGPDPTPPADDSASAGAINASVAEAQDIAVNAQLEATGAPDTPQARAEAAKNVLGDSEAASATAGSAAARQGRPATVDPSAGDPLPAQPR